MAAAPPPPAAVNDQRLHVFFMPFLAPGHMIPMVDLAKLFAIRGGPSVTATIVTTSANAPLVTPALSQCSPNFPNINIHLLTLPSFPPSVPSNLTHSPTPDLTPPFIEATESLKQPFDDLILAHRPDCIVSDVFFPWTADLAHQHGIPRLAFHGSCVFSVILIGNSSAVMKLADDDIDSDTPFVIPGIPHRIKMLKFQFPNTRKDGMLVKIMESLKKTYGMVMNTFAELEGGYAEMMGGRAWLVGPVALCNGSMREIVARGGEEIMSSRIDECIKWLDGKKPGSVLYVCFGSLGRFTTAQLHEIATALSDCDHPFIWVVRDAGEWMPDGELGRKGLMIRRWAPQVAILNHSAVGGFVTHCGWNSCLEGLTAGMPMVTWPQFSEQFLNERLLVDVLRVGVSVGAKVCSGAEEKRTLVKGEEVTKAVNKVMGGREEAKGRRKRAKEVAEMAKRAMEEGGSSYKDMDRLIQELMEVKKGQISLELNG